MQIFAWTTSVRMGARRPKKEWGLCFLSGMRAATSQWVWMPSGPRWFAGRPQQTQREPE